MIAIGIAFVYYYVNTRAILSKIDLLEFRTNLMLDKLEKIDIPKPKKQDLSEFSGRLNTLDALSMRILDRINDLSQQRMQQYPPQQPYAGLQADINKIMIAMVSLPGKIQNTHNRLDEVLVIWKKMLEMRKK